MDNENRTGWWKKTVEAMKKAIKTLIWVMVLLIGWWKKMKEAIKNLFL